MSCASSFSNSDYFDHIHDILEGNIEQVGCGSRSHVQSLRPILTKYKLKQSIVQKYDKLIDADLYDFDGKEFVIQSIKKRAERLGFHKNLSSTLQIIGFTKEKSRSAEYAIEPFINTSYTNSQLIDICIDYIFGALSKHIGQKNKFHYFEPENVDAWFMNDENINVLNAPYSANVDNIEMLINNVKNMGVSTKQYDLFYHTTTWEYAFSIAHKIDHTIGRPCLDFGVKPGFYLGTRLYNTLEWGQKISRHCKEIATLVFLVPKKYPETLNYKKLIGNEWTQVTKKSRRCELKRFRRELEELENIDLVFGNIVGNSENIRSLNDPPIPLKDRLQLVSKTDRGDEFLDGKIAGIIFYKKNI